MYCWEILTLTLTIKVHNTTSEAWFNKSKDLTGFLFSETYIYMNI